jgi:hypothetical protein
MPEDAEKVDQRGGSSGATGRVTPAQQPGTPAVQRTDGAAPRVIITRVRADSTPTGMPDRIPPRVDTPVRVAIAGAGSSAGAVTFTVDGAGGASGSATIDGAEQAELSEDGIRNLQLRGVDQTSPGSAGGLTLLAEQGGAELARSNPFSVAAIPQNWTVSFRSRIGGTHRGFNVTDHWESDSGQVTDLNETEISEEVQCTESTGCFSGVEGTTSDYMPGDEFTGDAHAIMVSVMTGPGFTSSNQTSKFRDNRTGAADIPMARSGYVITRTVARTIPLIGALRVTTEKGGRATTANSITSGAGSGSVSRTQDVHGRG